MPKGVKGFSFREKDKVETNKQWAHVAIFKKHNKKPWRCVFCGKKVVTLEVHHLDGDHFNNDPVNLAATHPSCHIRHHNTGKKATAEHKRNLSLSHWQGTETHCKHGHEMTVENTYIKPNGGKQCRQCIRDRNRKQREKSRVGR